MDTTVAAERAATINGTVTHTGAGPDDPAVEVLRDRLDLTGTKLVCGTGVCGACTILVDGTPTVSCLTPRAALDGRAVTTVEGLGGSHPAQRAFVAHDALQCGYCTPGFVVEAAAFVDRWRAAHGDTVPPRATIAEALAGHLCRCGAYPAIYAAVAAACTGQHDQDHEQAPAPGDREPHGTNARTPAANGREGPRVDAVDKVTGRARYTTDIRLDGQLEGVIVRSAQPHARVLAVDTGQAPAVDLLPADRVVRYVGQPIAAVAAATHAEARAAAAAVTVRYEPLPALLDPGAAARADAPVLYGSRQQRKAAPSSFEGPMILPGRWRGNVRGPAGFSWRSGTASRRIAAARRRGDERLVEATFTTQVQVHTPLEPHATVARWDADGAMRLHVSTQDVGGLAEEAAHRWGLAVARVHVTAEHVGGGFGAKTGLRSDTVAAVELARVTGAPVRVVLSRAEELTDAGNRPGTRTDLSLLADAGGRLAALDMDTTGDGGVSISSTSAVLANLMYGTAPRRLRDSDVVTNFAPASPFRGPGAPAMLWALEQAVDELAVRLEVGPLELRRRWDRNPRRRALYEWAAALPVWRERPAAGAQRGRFRRGVGVAAGTWLYMTAPATRVELTVESGVVVARTGTTDVGTGSRTVIATVLRTELGLPADRVRVEVGDSRSVRGPGAFGSRVTTSVGPATRDAAAKLRAALHTPAGNGHGDRGVLAALDRADGVRVTGGRPRDRGGYLSPAGMNGGQLAIGRGLTGAVHVTEVEVDTRLGTVRPLRVWGGIAAGRIYAPRPAVSQCEGGIVQGIGYALYEERVTDPNAGVVLTDNLEDYRIAGIADTPEITIHFHQEGYEHVGGGGVGLGEVSTVGVAASVGNAVFNATGWRPHDLPIRPDRLLAGVASQQQSSTGAASQQQFSTGAASQQQFSQGVTR